LSFTKLFFGFLIKSSPKNYFKIIAMKKIKMTLEKLAQEMRRGFAGIDKRFLAVDRRFDEVDKKFDGIDKKFDEIDKKFGKIDKKFERIDAKIDEKVDSLARAVKVGFDEFGERFDRFECENAKQHNIINIRLDNLERGQDKIAERLGVVERKRV